MKRILNFELRRAMCSKSFRIAVLCGTVITTLDFYEFYRKYRSITDERVVGQAWIGLDYQFSYNALFYLLMPLFACFAYAGSYFEDKRSGYIKNIMVKTSRKKYFASKYMVTFFTAAIAVAIPLILNLMLSMSVFSLRLPEKLDFMSAGGTKDTALFSRVFWSDTLLYCLIFILIDMIFAGCIAVFSICIADFTDNMFSTVAIPFAAIVISSTFFEDYDLYGITESNISIVKMIDPIQESITTGRVMALVLLCMLFVSAVWIIIKQKNKDIL